MWINEDELDRAGLDRKKVESIARRLSRAALDARKLGLHVFGGSGNGSLRFNDDSGEPNLVIAHIDGPFDGGDGAERQDENGLWRGE